MQATSPYLNQKCRSLEQVMRATIADKISDAQWIAERIEELMGKIDRYMPDELEECKQRLEQAADEARCAARKLYDQLPQERLPEPSRAM